MGQKRNQYLDISDEEEDIHSETENEEQSRATRIRQSATKKRKLSHDSDQLSKESGSEDDDEDTTRDIAESANEEISHVRRSHPRSHSTTQNSEQEPASQIKGKVTAALKLSNAHQKKKKKTGVIYLSRIPPFMKPSALRHLLSPYGTLLRIFLTPEPSPAYLKRVKSGGNKKRSFVDGWVEFASKKKAKICAETLNGNIIGGKKGGWYHDDIWNMKYLKGFKWDDLMEQVQDEERLREGRLRAEFQQEAKERRAFLENVEQDKKEKTREAKRKKRSNNLPAAEKAEDSQRPIWTQNKVKQTDKQMIMEPQDELKRVLSKIF